MAITINKKMSYAIDKLLDRQDYLVTQANDLARSLGNLTAFEHKVLDYCFSFVTKDDEQDKVYHLTALEIIKHLGLTASGDSYNRVVQAFRGLNEGTALYMQTQEPEGRRGILMTSLFDYIKVIDTGDIEFSFSRKVAPYVLQLKEKYYSFRLSELSRVRSKYTMSMMKLWNAKADGIWRDYSDPSDLPPNATIKGDLEEWESWFLGSDDKGQPIRWPAGRFKKDCLNVAIKELERLYPRTAIEITTFTAGRRTIGYQIKFRSIKTTLTIDGKTNGDEI